MREDILAAYRKHLSLTDRAKKATPVEMNIEELKARIKALNDSEILEIEVMSCADNASTGKLGGS